MVNITPTAKHQHASIVIVEDISMLTLASSSKQCKSCVQYHTSLVVVFCKTSTAPLFHMKYVTSHSTSTIPYVLCTYDVGWPACMIFLSIISFNSEKKEKMGKVFLKLKVNLDLKEFEGLLAIRIAEVNICQKH